MLRKGIFILLLFLTVAAHGQKRTPNSSQNNGVISNMQHLSAQQLFDTANYYLDKHCTDTALIFYNFFINKPVKNADVEHQKKMVEAYNKSAVIYYHLCDFRSAYEYLIRALFLGEEFNYHLYEPKIYTNIGNIYYRFNQYDIAKIYYSKALHSCQDTATIVILLNNLGTVEVENRNLDSASFYLEKSLQISKRNEKINLHTLLNTMAWVYQNKELYDSAFYYYKWSLEEARENEKIEKQAEILSNISKLYFDVNKTDSALFYINLSNNIAEKSHFLSIIAENYLTLSKIEEAKGRHKSALVHYKKYALLNDSIFKAENFGDINQLQRLYEVSKTNKQIEQLVVEQQMKEQQIRYQNIIQFIILCILLLVSVVLAYIYLQKRNLSKAYKKLFEKNIQIIELQDHSTKREPEKYKKSPLTDEMQEELLERILTLMEDNSIVCDPEFSLDKLAELVQSNHTYVSQVINTALKKNFRSFLNSYRIQEAQQLFSELDIAKYTIESVAYKVGFKSPSAFRSTFKETTGVSPNYYLNALREGKTTA
ncbi:MAG: helix-turn-helix domain-containing protein [Bacteroidales bacterium]|jgi:AraC-like DNA-binding protein|nr:helix-turn-helix domain-containing protein [Bacteroidales bacterium]